MSGAINHGTRPWAGARAVAWAVVVLARPFAADADVERCKTEAGYLARLAQLGYAELREDFEGGDWEHVRSVYPGQNVAVSVTSQRVTWASAGHDLWPTVGSLSYITTNQNWARGDGWGIYDTWLISTIRITVPEPVYGVGLWVDTNPDLEEVGFLFTDRTSANEPGYVLPGFGAMYPGDNPGAGHEFIGIIDPDGFVDVVITGTLEVNEEGVLEGGTVFGADDFALAVAPGFLQTPLKRWRAKHFTDADLADPSKEATVWGNEADPDMDCVINAREYVFGGDPDLRDRAVTLLTATVDGVGPSARLRFSYRRRTDDPALVYTPQVSLDGQAWHNGVEYVGETETIPLGDDLERVTCTDTGALVPRDRVFGLVAVTGIAP